MNNPEKQNTVAIDAETATLVATQAARKAKLASIRQIQGRFETRGEIETSSPSLAHRIQAKLVEGGKVAAVAVGFKSVTKVEELGPDLVVEVAADFEVIYERLADIDLPEDQFLVFARVTAVHNAWPYFRVFFQQALAAMQLPPHTTDLLLLLPAAEMAGYKSAPSERKSGASD